MGPGTRLGPYQVVAAIGAGGMGEVFRARDERLARDVAIKLVSAYSTDSAGARERFTREAQAVAALQHPNICTIHDVGETADGRAFLVMELLQGETLQQRIAHGPLDLRALLEIGTAITDGLHTAHAAGIVHRDIKPANVMLTSQGPKLLDFGLVKADPRLAPGAATAAELETRAQLTDAGSAVGTWAYMSPEQLRGEEVDARTDLFSLGLVLYEMATGHPAFAGSSAVVGAAILHQEPAPLRSLRSDLPEGFEHVVHKALEKDRQLRYQTAADLRADLQRLKRSSDQHAATLSGAAVVPPRRPKRTLVAAIAAVLTLIGIGYWVFSKSGPPLLTESDTIVLSDFTNTTGDTVFDDALRQGLMVQLKQSPFLHVLSDQRVRRVMTMMGRPPETRLTPAVALEVCERSSSAAVIQGSIATLGNQYVLGLRATGCQSGEVVDTQQSQVPRKEDVLGALSVMARAFRQRAGESLATIKRHEKPLQEATTASIEALKAYSATAAPGFGGCDARLSLLKRAVELDSEFALAHAVLGVCYSGLGQRDLAIQSSTRAYELRQRTTDPERFFIEYAYDRDVTGDLEKAFQTATLWTQTYPRDVSAHSLRGGYSAHGTGRYEDVIQSAGRALALEPDSVFAHSELVSANMFLDRFDAAARALERAGGLLEPGSLALGYYMAVLAPHAEGAERWVARFRESSNPHMRHAESLVLARRGQLERARTLARGAIDATEALGRRETAAGYEAAAAVWEAWSGNRSTARRRADAALRMSGGRDVSYAAGFALALAGETARLDALANELERRFPRDTIVRFTYVPTLRALAALARAEPARAIELLQANVSYERAVPPTAFNFFFGSLYPVHVRAQAYAANGQHERAVAEFQKILDHRGLMMGDPAGARALLDKARSQARAGDRTGARAAYQEFLALWKDADADVPLLAEARAEYANLK